MVRNPVFIFIRLGIIITRHHIDPSIYPHLVACLPLVLACNSNGVYLDLHLPTFLHAKARESCVS